MEGEQYMEQLVQFTQQIPLILQILFTSVLGAIPFIEAEVAAAIATLAGTPVIFAIIAAAIGNFLAVFLIVIFAQKIRKWRNKSVDDEKRGKAMKAVHKYGIPTASLLSPLITGMHILAFAAAVTGANRQYILVWQAVAIVLWAIAGGVLVSLGMKLIG
jgi:hypothetical protein